MNDTENLYMISKISTILFPLIMNERSHFSIIIFFIGEGRGQIVMKIISEYQFHTCLKLSCGHRGKLSRSSLDLSHFYKMSFSCGGRDIYELKGALYF